MFTLRRASLTLHVRWTPNRLACVSRIRPRRCRRCGREFLLWQGKVPSVIDASQLKAGDRITVRIRALKVASLTQLESTPANHVGDHEPGSPANENN
jgi:hypothetical protein